MSEAMSGGRGDGGTSTAVNGGRLDFGGVRPLHIPEVLLVFGWLWCLRER